LVAGAGIARTEGVTFVIRVAELGHAMHIRARIFINGKEDFIVEAVRALVFNETVHERENLRKAEHIAFLILGARNTNPFSIGLAGTNSGLEHGAVCIIGTAFIERQVNAGDAMLVRFAGRLGITNIAVSTQKIGVSTHTTRFNRPDCQTNSIITGGRVAFKAGATRRSPKRRGVAGRISTQRRGTHSRRITIQVGLTISERRARSVTLGVQLRALAKPVRAGQTRYI